MKVPYDVKITHHIKRGEAGDKMEEAMSKTIRDIMDLIMEYASDAITEGPYHDGYLLDSGVVYMIEPLRGIVGFTAKHARPVEFGSKPHWPPPVPIYEWCRRKLGESGRPMTETDENTQLLFRIAFPRGRSLGRRMSNAEKAFRGVYRKIGTKGTEPQPFLRIGSEKAKAEVRPLLQGNLREVGLA